MQQAWCGSRTGTSFRMTFIVSFCLCAASA